VRTGIAFSFLLLLLCSGTRTRAQVPDRATDEKTVRALDDQERAAVLKRDRTVLERLWSDQFTVRFTNIWRKEEGTWRMIARHAHVIPPS